MSSRDSDQDRRLDDTSSCRDDEEERGIKNKVSYYLRKEAEIKYKSEQMIKYWREHPDEHQDYKSLFRSFRETRQSSSGDSSEALFQAWQKKWKRFVEDTEDIEVENKLKNIRKDLNLSSADVDKYRRRTSERNNNNSSSEDEEDLNQDAKLVKDTMQSLILVKEHVGMLRGKIKQAEELFNRVLGKKNICAKALKDSRFIELVKNAYNLLKSGIEFGSIDETSELKAALKQLRIIAKQPDTSKSGNERDATGGPKTSKRQSNDDKSRGGKMARPVYPNEAATLHQNPLNFGMCNPYMACGFNMMSPCMVTSMVWASPMMPSVMLPPTRFLTQPFPYNYSLNSSAASSSQSAPPIFELTEESEDNKRLNRGVTNDASQPSQKRNQSLTNEQLQLLVNRFNQLPQIRKNEVIAFLKSLSPAERIVHGELINKLKNEFGVNID